MKVCPYCTNNILFQHSYEYESHFFILKLSANSATSLTPLCNWCFAMHAYRSRCGCFAGHSCRWRLQGNECFTACIQRHQVNQVAVPNNPCYLVVTRMVRVLLDRGYRCCCSNAYKNTASCPAWNSPAELCCQRKNFKQLNSVLLYQASLLSISPLKHVNLWDGFLPYFRQELIRISLQVLVYYHCCEAEFTFLHWSIKTKSTHHTPSPHMKKTHLTRRSKFYIFYCCKVTTSLLVLPVIFEEWLEMNENVILEAHTEIGDIKQR